MTFSLVCTNFETFHHHYKFLVNPNFHFFSKQHGYLPVFTLII
uniref:Uncharacterized protein n=1 Tax=Arundo donax TaxID=35708 RepID=A0A0A9FS66_ARUDO